MQTNSDRTKIKLTVFIILISLALTQCSSKEQWQNKINAQQLKKSLIKGNLWLINQDIRRRDVVAFGCWTARQAGFILPQLSQDLDQKCQAVYRQKYQQDLLLKRLLGSCKKLPLDDYSLFYEKKRLQERLTNDYLGISQGGTQDFLVISLYADDPRIPVLFEEIFQALFNNHYHRYGTTHQFLALLFLKENNHFSRRKIDRKLDRLGRQMEKELELYLEKKEFTDLIAEIMAMLVKGSQIERIKPEWIYFLLQSQQNDGNWLQSINESNYFEPDMDQHATILSLYTLTAYYKKHYWQTNLKANE